MSTPNIAIPQLEEPKAGVAAGEGGVRQRLPGADGPQPGQNWRQASRFI